MAADLAASAPGLVSRLSIFARLEAGEPVPREPRVTHARCRPRHRLLLRAARTETGQLIVATAAMAMATAAMIVAMLALGTAAHPRMIGPCTQQWVMACVGH